MLRSTHGLLSLGRRAAQLPPTAPAPSPEELAEVQRLLAERNGGDAVPLNFVPTAPAFDPTAPHMRTGRMPQVGLGVALRRVCLCLAGQGCDCRAEAAFERRAWLLSPAQHAVRNPQTVAFLDMLGLPYNLDHEAAAARDYDGGQAGAAPGYALAGELGIVAVRDDSWKCVCHGKSSSTSPGLHADVANPEEIDLEEEDDVVDGDDAEAAAVDSALAAVLPSRVAAVAAAANPEEIDLGEE